MSGSGRARTSGGSKRLLGSRVALCDARSDDPAMRMSRSLAMVAFAALSLPVSKLSAQKVLTPEILSQMHRVSGLTLAPDGKHLLFTVSTPDLQANKNKSSVFLLDLTQPANVPREVAVGSSP